MSQQRTLTGARCVTQFAYLIRLLKTRRIFDDTPAMYGIELEHGLRQNRENQDCVVSGDGYFQTGRTLTYQQASNNRFFVARLQAFGIETQGLANAAHGSGPLPGSVL